LEIDEGVGSSVPYISAILSIDFGETAWKKCLKKVGPKSTMPESLLKAAGCCPMWRETTRLLKFTKVKMHLVVMGLSGSGKIKPFLALYSSIG